MRAKGLVFKFEVEVGLKSFALSRPERNLNHRPQDSQPRYAAQTRNHRPTLKKGTRTGEDVWELSRRINH